MQFVLGHNRPLDMPSSSKKDPLHPHNPNPKAYTGGGDKSYDTIISTETFHGFDLHFDELNQRLNAVKKEFGMRRAVSTRSLAGETRTFAEILDQEVETVVFYYLEVQGILAKQIRLLRIRQTRALEICVVTLEVIEELCVRYREIGQEVLALLTYLERNSIALKKILQRHDLLFDQKMGSIYFDTRLANGTSTRSSQLKQLYHQEGVKAIIEAIRRGFEELYDARQTLLSPYGSGEMLNIDSMQFSDGDISSSKRRRRKIVPRVPFKKRLASFSSLNLLDGKVEKLELTRTSVPQPSSCGLNAEDSGYLSDLGQRAHSTGNLFSYLAAHEQRISDKNDRARSLSELEPILRHINEVSDRVTKTQSKTTLEFISNLGAMGLEFSIRDLNRVEKEIKGESVISQDDIVTSKVGLYLNLYVTFLYLANQYIVAPSSAKYANMLGLGPAMSGMIIGFAPAAALGSSLAYSMWTNYSFKSPLLTGICCGIMGNLLYGAALQFHSPLMIFLGRMLTGFGGTRVVSRRYIADHVSLQDRLVASSEFVTAGAMGLAFGPLIASLIELSDVSFSWRFVRYENVTAPGWIMAFMWFTALMAVVLLFQEPFIKRVESFSTEPIDTPPSWMHGRVSRGASIVKYGSIPSHEVVCVELGDELWVDDPKLGVQLQPHSLSNHSHHKSFKEDKSLQKVPTFARYSSNDHQMGRIHLQDRAEDERIPSCWSHITTEVYVILFLTMVNKAGQEMSVSSMPFIMKNLFSWDTESIGYCMASIGAFVLPANILVNQFGKELEERKLLLYLSYATMVGVIFICQLDLFDISYSSVRYLFGTVLIFTTLNGLEGVIMSLLSKLISPELAKGTFNSGLLATEAGTFGRVVGDMAITIFGDVTETTSLVNQLYFPLGGMIFLAIILSTYFYSKLED